MDVKKLVAEGRSLIPSSVTVMHAHPGRVRLKLPQIKRDPGFAREVKELLGPVPGIKKVETSSLTGSLLILYDSSRIGSLETLEALEPVAEALAPHFPDLDLKEVARWLGRLSEHWKTTQGSDGMAPVGSRR